MESGELAETRVEECVGCRELWFVRMDYRTVALKDNAGHTYSVHISGD